MKRTVELACGRIAEARVDAPDLREYAAPAYQTDSLALTLQRSMWIDVWH